MRQLRIRAIARPAVREGVLCGIILGVILLVISLVANFDANISTILNYILIVGGYGYAGYRAARVTKLVRTGIIAGLIAGSITYFISLLATMLVVIINIDAIRAGAISTVPVAQRAQYTNEYIIFLILFQFIVQLVVVGTVAGALFGAFGGFMAKRSSARVAATADQSGNVVDSAEPAVAPRRSFGGNMFTRRSSQPTEPVEVVDETESAQEEKIPAEEVETAPSEVTASAVEPSQDEVETEEKVDPSQDKTVAGEVKETPAPGTKKNYRSFLSQ